jgi:hypothetical protein
MPPSVIRAAAPPSSRSLSGHSTTSRSRAVAACIPPRNDSPPSQNGIEPHLNYSAQGQSVVQMGPRIVPHCFLREQGGKKPVFDQHIWQPFGKTKPARPYMGRQESTKRPILGINQWRAGRKDMRISSLSLWEIAKHPVAQRREGRGEGACCRSAQQKRGGPMSAPTILLSGYFTFC